MRARLGFALRLAWLLLPAALLPACGAAATSSTVPKITVVTALYPLAQAAEQVGLGAVNVVDLVPPGADPLTYLLSPAQVAQVNQAAVVLQADPTLQPWFSAAVARRSVVTISPVGGDAAVWLSPFQMEAAASQIARALIAANPAGAADYRNGEADFTDQLQSLDVDFQNTLGACTRHVIVTADNAFSLLQSRYGVTDDVIGSLATSQAAAEVRGSGATAVFEETWASTTAAQLVASAAGVPVKTLDTLDGVPAGGWPAGATYFSLMEQDLGTLNSALGCPNPALS